MCEEHTRLKVDPRLVDGVYCAEGTKSDRDRIRDVTCWSAKSRLRPVLVMKPRLDHLGKAVDLGGRFNALREPARLSKRFKPHLLHNCLMSHHRLASIQCILAVMSLYSPQSGAHGY